MNEGKIPRQVHDRDNVLQETEKEKPKEMVNRFLIGFGRTFASSEIVSVKCSSLFSVLLHDFYTYKVEYFQLVMQ